MAKQTKIQLLTKTTTEIQKNLSDIDLALGEPLVDTNTKTLIVGDKDSNGKASGEGSKTIILGASETVLGDVSNNSIEIKHIDNIERSKYTLKTTDAKLSKTNNEIEIKATYGLTANSDNELVLTDANGVDHSNVSFAGGTNIGISTGDNALTIALVDNPKVETIGIGDTSNAPVSIIYDSTINALKFVFN